MITVKIACDNGNTWTTGINTDLNEARNYFMGQQFTREDDNGNEKVDTVVNVELDNEVQS